MRSVLLVGLVCFSAAAPSAARAAEKTASIHGTVTYRPDPDKPWRYSRYYVRNKKTGALAEAVVALDIPSRKKFPRNDKIATHTIDQRDFQFTPETVAIRLGDKVKFANSDNRLHNVRTNDGARPFSFNLDSDEARIQTFVKPTGTRRPIRIGCAFHGGMRSWVFVYHHPWFQLTGADGQFALKDIPPGRYTLEMLHPAGNLLWRKTVSLKPGERLKLDIQVSPENLKEKTS
jgi:plastocyanin